MLDGPIHAALVTVFTWLVHIIFTAIGIDLGGEIATQIATVIVAYILSLFGLALWVRATIRVTALRSGPQYTPPFT